MKAVCYERKGPASEVLHYAEQPRPQPAAGEVRVRIHVSGVNPSDTKNRAGTRGRDAMPFALIIPHQDGAGVIDAVGAGVDASRIGERVWVYEAAMGRPFGTCAQYTAVPSHKAVVLPDNADFEAGACMGVPAMTAHRCVLADGPVAGKTVLVQGGAGSVGFYAVQIAKLSGARVIATVSRDQQARQALLAGADHVINYKTENVPARISEITAPDPGVDRVIEVSFGANLAADVEVIKPNGVIAAYNSDAVPEVSIAYRSMSPKNLTLRFVLVYGMPREAHEEAERFITQTLAQGAFKHQFFGRFALADTAAAHEATESMTNIGKVLVRVD